MPVPIYTGMVCVLVVKITSLVDDTNFDFSTVFILSSYKQGAVLALARWGANGVATFPAGGRGCPASHHTIMQFYYALYALMV